MTKVILNICLGAFLILAMATPTLTAQAELEEKIDLLFVLASSGEIMYRDMVQPAIDSIAALGDEAVPRLIDKFDTKSARERVTIINILKKIGSPAVPDLVRALNRDDGLIVQRVCGALGEIADSGAVDGLVAISGNERWQVRDQAIAALGKIGHPGGSESVSGALTDTIGQVRKSAAVSTGKLHLNESIEHLVHLLGDSFYGARLSAMHSLLKLDTVRVMTALKDSLNSKNDFIGDLGCKILGDIATDEALDVLLGQLNSLDPNRRAHAAIAMIKADPLDNCGYRERFFPREADPLVQLKIKSAISDLTDE